MCSWHVDVAAPLPPTETNNNNINNTITLHSNVVARKSGQQRRAYHISCCCSRPASNRFPAFSHRMTTIARRNGWQHCALQCCRPTVPWPDPTNRGVPDPDVPTFFGSLGVWHSESLCRLSISCVRHSVTHVRPRNFVRLYRFIFPDQRPPTSSGSRTILPRRPNGHRRRSLRIVSRLRLVFRSFRISDVVREYPLNSSDRRPDRTFQSANKPLVYYPLRKWQSSTSSVPPPRPHSDILKMFSEPCKYTNFLSLQYLIVIDWRFYSTNVCSSKFRLILCSVLNFKPHYAARLSSCMFYYYYFLLKLGRCYNKSKRDIIVSVVVLNDSDTFVLLCTRCNITNSILSSPFSLVINTYLSS